MFMILFLCLTQLFTSSVYAKSTEGTQIEIGGKIYTYTKTYGVRASAYSACPKENGKWGAKDALGKPLKLGTIAVDPKEIPLGTQVYVTGYKTDSLPKEGLLAVASDKGSAIKGKKIDIFLPCGKKAVKKFGLQKVKIYIIQK